MNRTSGARAFFPWMGSLPALGAALLLAASPGAAWAQRGVDVGFGFEPAAGSVAGNASSGPSTPPLLKANLVAWGLPPVSASNRASEANRLGTTSEIQLRGVPTTNPPYTVDGGDMISFVNADKYTLTITPDANNDNDWDDNTYLIKVESDKDDIVPHPGVYTLTIVDDDVLPVTEFSRNRIRMVAGTSTSVEVRLASGAPGASIPDSPDVDTVFGDQELKLAVSRPDDVVVGSNTSPCADGPEVLGIWDPMRTTVVTTSAFTSRAVSGPDAGNTITLDKIKDIHEFAGQTLRLQACAGSPSFRDTEIAFTFDEKSLMTDKGRAIAGEPLVVIVEGNAEPPVIDFTTTNAIIEEGRADTVALVAAGPAGTQIGSVDVTVSGEAALTLWQDSEQLEANADGSFTIDFGNRANTLLEIRAPADGSLADGVTRMATIAVTNANGATIGDRGTISITVSGATAVPALPLVGQLLLALLLAAGGARLRRP